MSYQKVLPLPGVLSPRTSTLLFLLKTQVSTPSSSEAFPDNPQPLTSQYLALVTSRFSARQEHNWFSTCLLSVTLHL